MLAEGKTADHVWRLLKELTQRAGIALATRVSEEQAKECERNLGAQFHVRHDRISRTLVLSTREHKVAVTGGVIAVLAAGTADVPVAEEARITAEVMGCRVFCYYDVGVAGIHRLVEPLNEIRSGGVGAVVAVAGMEGALPTVVRGLVEQVVIGVPTSTGYGYGGRGEAALMTMLQSCAPGLTVVNIDNGFGAGATAALIANAAARSAERRSENSLRAQAQS